MALLLVLSVFGDRASAQTPTATAPLIVNQGPTYRCYSWYAEVSDAGGYPSDAEWDCPYPDHYGRFTLGTDQWKNYPEYWQTDPGFSGSVDGAQGSPLTISLHNNATGVDCSPNKELAFTYDFPTQALYSNVNTLDLSKWDQVIIEFDVNIIYATHTVADCMCLNYEQPDCPNWTKAHFTTDILYWYGEEQHDTGDYNVISVRHLDPYINRVYGFANWTNASPGQDHYGHRIQFSDYQAQPGQQSHVKLDFKYLMSKYSNQLCQGGNTTAPVHLNSIQFVLVNAGTATTLEITNVKANAFNYAPGDYTSTSVAPGCTPYNCPVHPTDGPYTCGTDVGAPITSTSSVTPAPCATTQTLYGQCGGNGWNGPTCCPSGAGCQRQNEYYSQCLTTTNVGARDVAATVTPMPVNA